MEMPVVKYIEENPIAAGLIAVIAGMLIALALPETKSEADLIVGIRERARIADSSGSSA
jgi:hypothetical protein